MSYNTVYTCYTSAREGGRVLQTLGAGERAEIINNLADLLKEHEQDILAANQRDLEAARNSGESTAIRYRCGIPI